MLLSRAARFLLGGARSSLRAPFFNTFQTRTPKRAPNRLQLPFRRRRVKNHVAAWLRFVAAVLKMLLAIRPLFRWTQYKLGQETENEEWFRAEMEQAIRKAIRESKT
jgi:hypothetical protein